LPGIAMDGEGSSRLWICRIDNSAKKQYGAS
jgi:hypothetical protein